MKKYREYIKYLDESHHTKMFDRYRDVIIRYSIKGAKGISHVHDRLKDRTKMTIDQFKKKFDKVIDKIIDNFKEKDGDYLAIFKKSGVKIPFRFRHREGPDEARIYTILGLDMSRAKSRDRIPIPIAEEIEIIIKE